MKRLIAVTTLGLALNFSSLSFAFDRMDLYTDLVVKREVKNDIGSENIEGDFMSFYTTLRMGNTATPLVADKNSGDENISVFGVQVPRNPRT